MHRTYTTRAGAPLLRPISTAVLLLGRGVLFLLLNGDEAWRLLGESGECADLLRQDYQMLICRTSPVATTKLELLSMGTMTPMLPPPRKELTRCTLQRIRTCIHDRLRLVASILGQDVHQEFRRRPQHLLRMPELPTHIHIFCPDMNTYHMECCQLLRQMLNMQCH